VRLSAEPCGAAPGTAVSDLSDELNKNKIMEIKKKIKQKVEFFFKLRNLGTVVWS